MKKISGTTSVWITNDYYGPAEIKRDGAKCVGKLSYCDHDMTSTGWTKIGKAQITLDLLSDEKMVESKVASIQAEITRVRADAENTITQLAEKLNSLLAIAA